MKDDYKELLGATVWVVNWNGSMKEGFVAGIDYGEGITILDKDDPTDELLCLNAEERFNRAPYDDIFDYVTLDIGMGILSYAVHGNVLNAKPASFIEPMSECAFK